MLAFDSRSRSHLEIWESTSQISRYNHRVIDRFQHLYRLRANLEEFPVVGLIGARQVGKTTLARELARSFAEPVTLFDLESSRDLARLEDPLSRQARAVGLQQLRTEVDSLP